MKKLFTYLKFHPTCCLPSSNLARPMKKWNFSFLFFLHICFNVLSVLSGPTSRNTDILSRFIKINYWPTWDQTIAAICICLQIYCFRRLRNRKIEPAEFLSCSLPCALPRSHTAVLGILRIRISNLIKLAWLRSPCWRDTVIVVVVVVVVVGDSARPRVYR